MPTMSNPRRPRDLVFPLALLVTAASEARAQFPLGKLEGSNPEARMGTAVGSTTLRSGASYALFGAPGANAATGLPNTGTVSVRVLANGTLVPPAPFFLGLSGTATGAAFGARLGGSRDGRIVIGAPRASVAPSSNNGVVIVVDASTGRTTSTMHGPTSGEQAGHAVGFVGDVDGNLIDDLVVGAPFGYGVGSCCWTAGGGVHLVDASPGLVTPTATFTGFGVNCPWHCSGAYSESLGHALAALGDVNGNGRLDCLAGSRLLNRTRILEWDPATATLVELRGDTGPASFGTCVVGLEDLSVPPDGVPDYAAGAPDARIVRVLDGATGAVLRSFVGVDNSFGSAIAAIGDQDGRGRGDLLIGAPAALAGMGSAFAFSVETGNLLGIVAGSIPGEALGTAVGAVADWTGDGRPELLIGAPLATIDDPNAPGTPMPNAGRALVVTLDCGARCSVPGCAPTPTSGLVPRFALPRGNASPGHTVFEVAAAELAPGTQALLLLGASALSIPIDLGAIGMPGCALGVDWFLSPAVATGSPIVAASSGQGSARYPLPIPSGIPLGTDLHAQWFVFDLGVPIFPGALSAATKFTVLASPY